MSACSSQEEPSDDVQQAVQDEETQEDGEEQSENVSEGNTETAEGGSFFSSRQWNNIRAAVMT